MTNPKTYPDWQKDIREAQAALNTAHETEEQKRNEAIRAERFNKATKLGAMLTGYGVPVDGPNMDDEEVAVEIDHYRFIMPQELGRASLYVTRLHPEEDGFDIQAQYITSVQEYSDTHALFLYHNEGEQGIKAMLAQALDSIDEAYEAKKTWAELPRKSQPEPVFQPYVCSGAEKQLLTALRDFLQEERENF